MARAGARTNKAGSGPPAGSVPLRRCAVYTRKSSEEGLDQEYNSLHAQREACEAYIRSQQHEGWRLLPATYDDGGLSGGTMERPALQRLLAAIRAGQVDTVVVYKVDRLTRSLADFAKMVEVFDARGASFVAVTQQFNTTTSMGRLTLNILLSFAQFEREVTGERIRDKIAASKRRGLWMGGCTPLGYAVENRKLVVVAEDAATVVALYRRYLALGSVQALKAALDAEGIVSKPRTAANGRPAGGTPYSRGALYALLSNPVYRGQVRHKSVCYPGQHQPILPVELQAAVQARLAAANNGGTGRRRAQIEPSPLAGKLFDKAGERLVPSHARKGERRYRYYVSASLLRLAVPKQDPSDTANIAPTTKNERGAKASNVTPAPPTYAASGTRAGGWRLPAREIEQAVWSAVAGILREPALLVPDMLAAGVTAERVQGVLQELDGIVVGSDATLRERLARMVARVELSPEGMMLTIETGITVDGAGGPDAPTVAVTRFVPHCIRRRGVEMRLVIDGAGAPTRDDPALLKIVARAHCWFEDLVEGRVASVQALADRHGVTARYVQRVLPLAMLAPALVEQIAAGRHPANLTVNRLTDHGLLPIHWATQDLLGN